MAERQLSLAGDEVPLRLRNEICSTGSATGTGGASRAATGGGAGGVTVTWTVFGPLPHATIEMPTPMAAATGSSVLKLINRYFSVSSPVRPNYRDERKTSRIGLGEAEAGA